jgi:hypothetical protein
MSTNDRPKSTDAARMQTADYWSVAVWWPSEGGYGGRSDHRTRAAAEQERHRLLRSGYKNVDVWRVRITVEPEANDAE